MGRKKGSKNKPKELIEDKKINPNKPIKKPGGIYNADNKDYYLYQAEHKHLKSRKISPLPDDTIKLLNNSVINPHNKAMHDILVDARDEYGKPEDDNYDDNYLEALYESAPVFKAVVDDYYKPNPLLADSDNDNEKKKSKDNNYNITKRLDRIISLMEDYIMMQTDKM